MSKIQNHDYYKGKVDWLKHNYPELSPIEFYRMIFPSGSFQKPEESNGDYQPNGLLQYRCPNYEENSMSCCVINDDLKTILDCINRVGRFKNHDFVLISGCSYVGSNKTNKNVRFCHAIIIDLDEVDTQNLSFLIGMAEEKIIPIPTALSVSGNGLHVVYVLKEPIPMYAAKAEMLKNLKAMLTRKIWNEKTSQDPNIQYQGIVQGYRAVGTQTKKGHIVRAFEVGEKVTIDELIETITEIDAVPFLTPNKIMSNGKVNRKIYSERIKKCLSDKHLTEDMLQELSYGDRWTIEELRQVNPRWFEDWYRRRVIEGQVAGHLHIGRTAYDKWLAEIKDKARQGNRRRCIYCLAAFAQKCDISADEFIADAYALLEPFNALTEDKSNPFKKSDIDSVIETYNSHNLTKMSLAAMERMTGIAYPKAIKHHNPEGKKGRPDKETIILQYLAEHPDETSVSKIARECNCSRPTIYKYLN